MKDPRLKNGPLTGFFHARHKTPSAIALVILAAGSSRRMGAPKQLLKYGGQSLLRHTATEAIASKCDPIFVVIGSQAEHMELEVADLPLELVRNDHWQNGMGTSIRAAMVELDSCSIMNELAGVIFAVCDQPFFSCQLIRELIFAFRKYEPCNVACTYDGALGVPALFDRSMFPELRRLADGGGAKSILEQSPAIVTVDFPNGHFDIDTPADYERLAALDRAQGEKSKEASDFASPELIALRRTN